MKSGRFQEAASEQRKKLRTRAQLMDAALSVISKKGPDAVTISDIVAASGLPRGTFYYHFESKDEIVNAIARVVTVALVDQTSRETESTRRGLERVALATSVFITLAAQEGDWARLIVIALNEPGPMQDEISKGIRKDVKLGLDEGSFPVMASDLLFQSALAVVSSGVRACIASPQNTGNARLEASTLVLRLLGVDLDVAMELPERMWETYMADAGRAPVLELPQAMSGRHSEDGER